MNASLLPLYLSEFRHQKFFSPLLFPFVCLLWKTGKLLCTSKSWQEYTLLSRFMRLSSGG